MSVVVKVSKELYIDDLKASLEPGKIYVLPKDVYESYIKGGYPIEYVDSLKTVFDKTNDFNNKKNSNTNYASSGRWAYAHPIFKIFKRTFSKYTYNP